MGHIGVQTTPPLLLTWSLGVSQQVPPSLYNSLQHDSPRDLRHRSPSAASQPTQGESGSFPCPAWGPSSQPLCCCYGQPWHSLRMLRKLPPGPWDSLRGQGWSRPSSPNRSRTWLNVTLVRLPAPATAQWRRHHFPRLSRRHLRAFPRTHICCLLSILPRQAA